MNQTTAAFPLRTDTPCTRPWILPHHDHLTLKTITKHTKILKQEIEKQFNDLRGVYFCVQFIQGGDQQWFNYIELKTYYPQLILSYLQDECLQIKINNQESVQGMCIESSSLSSVREFQDESLDRYRDRLIASSNQSPSSQSIPQESNSQEESSEIDERKQSQRIFDKIFNNKLVEDNYSEQQQQQIQDSPLNNQSSNQISQVNNKDIQSQQKPTKALQINQLKLDVVIESKDINCQYALIEDLSKLSMKSLPSSSIMGRGKGSGGSQEQCPSMTDSFQNIIRMHYSPFYKDNLLRKYQEKYGLCLENYRLHILHQTETPQRPISQHKDDEIKSSMLLGNDYLPKSQENDQEELIISKDKIIPYGIFDFDALLHEGHLQLISPAIFEQIQQENLQRLDRQVDKHKKQMDGYQKMKEKQYIKSITSQHYKKCLNKRKNIAFCKRKDKPKDFTRKKDSQKKKKVLPSKKI